MSVRVQTVQIALVLQFDRIQILACNTNPTLRIEKRSYLQLRKQELLCPYIKPQTLQKLVLTYFQFAHLFISGLHCETISDCSVPCEHGRCTHRPDVCECETNWAPEGTCNTYVGPCLNCSSTGGTCEEGPNTCKCKPGERLWCDCFWSKVTQVLRLRSGHHGI